MNKEKYLKCIEFFSQSQCRSKVLFLMNKVVPISIACIYGVLGVILFFGNPLLMFRFIGIPFLAFVFVTILRKVINKKRPYEVYDFMPIRYNNKTKSGQSFPSRHCACASVIAVTCMVFSPILGVILIVLAFVVAVARVVSGVHFVRDVFFGLLFGAIIGIIGFYPYVF